MRIYVAGNSQEVGGQVAVLLKNAGHIITSSWLNEKKFRSNNYTPERRRAIAEKDRNEIAGSDCLVLISSPTYVPGGKFVEAGIAMGMGITVHLIGHRENMLLWHPQVCQWDNVEKLISFLAAQENRD